MPSSLKTQEKHRIAIDAWRQCFAQLYGLDYASANSSVEFLRWILVPPLFGQKLVRVLRSKVTGRLPLQNAYDASIAAGVLRAAPGRMDSFRFLTDELRSTWRGRTVG